MAAAGNLGQARRPGAGVSGVLAFFRPANCYFLLPVLKLTRNVNDRTTRVNYHEFGRLRRVVGQTRLCLGRDAPARDRHFRLAGGMGHHGAQPLEPPGPPALVEGRDRLAAAAVREAGQ